MIITVATFTTQTSQGNTPPSSFVSDPQVSDGYRVFVANGWTEGGTVTSPVINIWTQRGGAACLEATITLPSTTGASPVAVTVPGRSGHIAATVSFTGGGTFTGTITADGYSHADSAP